MLYDCSIEKMIECRASMSINNAAMRRRKRHKWSAMPTKATIGRISLPPSFCSNVPPARRKSDKNFPHHPRIVD